MSDFDFDCLERKRLARQSRYRKNGSKSKKCNLPSDKLTHKQWKERCGPIMSYNLNAPINWEDFKNLDGNIQERYITNLQAKYGATATDLAKMFGIKALTVRRLVESGNLNITFPRGHAMSQAQKAEWNKFLGEKQDAVEETTAKDEAVCEVTVEDAVVEDADGLAEEKLEEKVAMNMKKVCLQFDGRINIDMIANSLRLILGNDPVGEMEIVCSLA